ncbi:hypothetical protein DFJ74DRAFT_629591 [Hyaloraphidium curvatum]|nr:hypothetical protein DFJ74DRAFT_629591 [Hyaloraphidium curvatum]
MTIFRPCIDIHAGVVKQIVGSSLSSDPSALKENHVAREPPAHFATLYRDNNLRGGHVIRLSADDASDTAAREALAAFPGGLQFGGGVNADNARSWLDAGAEKVIVTSWLFPGAKFDGERLRRMAEVVGREALVVDVSCKRRQQGGDGPPRWTVATNKWQTLADMDVDEESLAMLAEHCSEFLVHAADVEGKQQGIDEELVACLGKWIAGTKAGCCYAGGGKSLSDLDLVARLSNWTVDLTFGSALDIFGGKGVTLADCVEWNQTIGGARKFRIR